MANRETWKTFVVDKKKKNNRLAKFLRACRKIWFETCVKPGSHGWYIWQVDKYL